MKKFHNYVYGRHFTIQSDHQPLSYLLDEQKCIPQQASARIQRWAQHIAIAFVTSPERLCAMLTLSADSLAPLQLLTVRYQQMWNTSSTTSQLRVSLRQTSEWTSKDPTLSQVQRFLLSGWPAKPPDKEFTPYFNKKNELSLQDGCILWGTRVVVPPPGRKGVLEELHETHPGISKMKCLARCYIWWPLMDSEIENLVRSCVTCQESRPSPAAAPLHPWVWPEKPWSHLHLDFAGSYLGSIKGSMYLVLVDAHSKWMEVVILPLRLLSSSGSSLPLMAYQRKL